MRQRLYSAAAVSVTAALMVTVAAALAESSLPTFAGGTAFPSIKGPADPEEFSWEVMLSGDQELQLVDDQHARVIYANSGVTAVSIMAELAHDAEGSEVPTSLNVSDGNVLTLTVHHRAGNPAREGTPFEYPIVAGDGWKGGFETEIVTGPKDEQELREERERRAREELEAEELARASAGCLVPKLKGQSLRTSKRRLKEAHCTIGKVRKRKGATAKTGKVVKQDPKPGTVLAGGAPVNLTVGE